MTVRGYRWITNGSVDKLLKLAETLPEGWQYGRSTCGTLHPMEHVYRLHRHNAIKAGIEFLFTFEEWLDVWQKSGHLHERGRGRHQYVMARFGDKGPYAVGNVRITTNAENAAEFWGNGGRIWITDNQKSRRVTVNTVLSEGWRYGRKYMRKTQKAAR